MPQNSNFKEIRITAESYVRIMNHFKICWAKWHFWLNSDLHIWHRIGIYSLTFKLDSLYFWNISPQLLFQWWMICWTVLSSDLEQLIMLFSFNHWIVDLTLFPQIARFIIKYIKNSFTNRCQLRELTEFLFTFRIGFEKSIIYLFSIHCFTPEVSTQLIPATNTSS